IASALVGDALGDLLGALEATGRVEVRALPAGVELGLALRTASERVGRDPERGPALGAARRRAASEDPERSARWWRLTALLTASGGAAPIALLPIPAVAQRLSFPAAGGTSCTSFRSRSSSDRCVRSSPPSACGARPPVVAG